jgi:ubiquinone/menaquinone biosynthesis C-methylase UbiE
MATSEQKSYDLERFDLDHESQRLRSQALMAWPQEARILTSFGLQDGMSVLEPGSGPGFITEALLDLLPHSTITSLELEPAMIERSERYLHGKADERRRLVQGSIMEIPFPDNSFDFAIGRFLYQHLPDPVGASKEVLRVLKPGGKLALIDVDDALWGIQDPWTPELEPGMKKFAEEQAKRGGNRYVGRRFWRILRAAGFEPFDLQAVLAHSDDIGLEPFAPMLDYNAEEAERLIQTGQTTREEMDIAKMANERFYAAPDPYVLIVLLAACGKKP